MVKVINISDKLDMTKPKIQIGDKQYVVDNSMKNVLKFEELSVIGKSESMMQAIKLTLGEKAVKEIGIADYSINNFKILTIAILAVMQGMAYEEAERGFLQQSRAAGMVQP